MINGVPGGGIPVPVKKSGSNGCWIWGLAGCGILALVGVIFVVVVSMKFSKNINQLSKSSNNTQATATRLITIRTALQRYQKEHQREYPPTLDDLVPKYLPSKSEIEGGEYTPPEADATGDTPIVRFEGGELLNMKIGKSSINQKMYTLLLKDGQIVIEQVTRSPLYPASSGSSGSDD